MAGMLRAGLCSPPVDRHFLTPLFNPRSLIVFAGDPEAEPPTREARSLRAALAAEPRFAGPITWLDIGMTGTLAERGPPSSVISPKYSPGPWVA